MRLILIVKCSYRLLGRVDNRGKDMNRRKSGDAPFPCEQPAYVIRMLWPAGLLARRGSGEGRPYFRSGAQLSWQLEMQHFISVRTPWMEELTDSRNASASGAHFTTL